MIATRLLGVVNVTPDSFSDGGRWAEPAAAIDHALALLDEGADAVDVGGESTRPGAAPVSEDVELGRVIPVIEGIARARPGATISVDTSKGGVARAAVDAGARWINDVRALSDPAVAQVAADAGATLVLMHARGTPATMQRDTAYADLVGEVRAFLAERAARARAAGVAADRIVIDPGLGFGKDPLDNPSLVAAVPALRALGHPVLIGASRKTFVGRLTGVQRPEDRVFGSIGAALAAAEAGADWLRVHDVAATRQALLVFAACRKPTS